MATHDFALTAKLSSNAYFAGDFLYCVVTVRSAGYFMLSAELHGLCRRDARWAPHHVVGEPVKASSARDLGFGQADTDSCMLECAQPTVLGCEVGGESRVTTYLFYAQLPYELVPSFRGSSFKFVYFVSVLVQVGQEKHRVLKVPFRVLRKSRIDGIDLDKPPLEPLKLGRAHGCITLSHPDDMFGFTEVADATMRGRIELARAAVEESGGATEWALTLPPHHCPLLQEADFVRQMAEERSAKFFERANGHGRAFAIQSKQFVVVDWRMDHSVLALDDSVKGVLDFSRGEVMCYRAHMALLMREIVRAVRDEPEKTIDHVVDELDRDTFNAWTLPVCFHLPTDHTQTFSTKYLSVRWVIKFVFYCGKQRINAAADEEIHSLATKAESALDKIEWELDVPLVVIGPSLPQFLVGEPAGVGLVL